MALATLNNYRTGISLALSGTNGTDWMLEPLYWDRAVEDRAVIYVRAATLLTLSHNARNRIFTNRIVATTVGANGLDGTPDSGDEGLIRYRVDGDMAHGTRWAGVSGAIFPQYTAPISFDTLSYAEANSGGVAVLGRVGSNGASVAPKSGYFHYGLRDSAGNECHTISVADDSRLVSGVYPESDNWADDGRYLMFVVDPLTPVIQTRATGTGQFYTTPWKTYQVPKIHTQKTYIQGTVEVEMKALSGENVFYRINGGSWVEHANPTLTDADFSTGSNTLECYYAGNSAFVLTRTVVKNPPFPSAGETHGNLWAGSDANWTAIQAKITRPAFSWYWANRFIRNNGNRTEWDAVRRQGTRRFSYPMGATVNAVCAKYYGNSTVPGASGSARSFAAYAKEMLLENTRGLDCVGFEMAHNGDPQPTKEHIYRGYIDWQSSGDMAYAYDILIAQYRSDQHASGITPIEDHYIRDCMASNINEVLMYAGGYTGNEALPSGTDYGAGLWDVPRKCGALLQALAMPTYSTSYYGTCGLDGTTTTYDWTPYPVGLNLTWKKIFLEDDATLQGYPGLSSRFGIDASPGASTFNFRVDGVFGDKADYVSLTGSPFVHAMNACKWHYPEKYFPNAELGYKLGAQGELYGTKALSNGTLGPYRYINLGLINSSFPEIANVAKPFVEAQVPNTTFSEGSLMAGDPLIALANYEDQYSAGSGTPTQAPSFTTQPVSATRTEGESVTFTVVTAGNPTPTRQWRKNGANISGQTGTSYTIASTVVGDAGIYDCVATNSVAPGGVVSAAATLVVNAIPPTPDPVTKRTNYKTPAAVIFAT